MAFFSLKPPPSREGSGQCRTANPSLSAKGFKMNFLRIVSTLINPLRQNEKVSDFYL